MTLTFTKRGQVMAPVYLLLTFVLMFVPSTIGQTTPKPQQLTAAELQNILVVKTLINNNPDLQKLLKAAESMPDNMFQGVTVSPIVSAAMRVFQDFLQLPSNQGQPSNASTVANVTNTPNITQPINNMAFLQQVMQNPLYTRIVGAVMEEVERGLREAEANNITVGTDLASLVSIINPMSILRKALVPALASLELQDDPDLVNPMCYDDIIDSLQALTNQESWAIEMFDALGKPTSGIEKGSLYFVGSYDECSEIQAHVTKNNGLFKTTRDFGTRHCRADIAIPKSLLDSLNVDTHGIHLKLIWGMCVPSSCHSQDVAGLFHLGIINSTGIEVEGVRCQPDMDLSSDKSAIAAIAILSFFGLMVTLGTLYDGCRAFNTPDSDREVGVVASKPPVSYASLEANRNPDNNSNGITTLTFKSIDVTVSNGTTAISKETQSKDDQLDVLPAGYVPHRHGTPPPLPKLKQFPAAVDTPISPLSNGLPNGGQQHGAERGPAVPSNNKSRAPKEPVLARILLCFSLYTNVPKILAAKSVPGSITCVHGIRFLSLMWVILGHSYNYGIISNEGTFTTDNLVDFAPILQRFTYQAVMAGGFAVDTFFVLSAFLLTWIQLKEADKRRKTVDIHTAFMYYFHRFWRLTPIYMIVLMSYGCLYRYLGSGPFWPNFIDAAEYCKDTWWTNLLYVNNLVKQDKQCMGWSWYLANDMQFYVISPIFILLMYIAYVPGVIGTAALMFMGIAFAFWKEYVYNGDFLTMMSDGGDYWRKVYTVPWCRVSCWAVGMLLGLVVYKRGRKPLKSKGLIAFCWLAATATALFLVYITHTKHKEGGEPWTRVENAFYESVGRTAWGICVAWVIFACHTGKGGVINSILSWRGLIPLSRLAYAAYLVHPICMEIYFFSRRAIFHVDDYNMIYLYLAHACVAFMVAFVCSLSFEAPFMGLEKVIFPTRRK